MKNFALTVSLLSYGSFCGAIAQAAEAPQEHVQDQTRSGVQSLGPQGPSKLLCDTGEGANIKKEIQTLTLDYLSNLNESGRAAASPKTSAQREAAREYSKVRLMQIMNEYDAASCFQGIAALSSLCPQLQSDKRIQAADASQQLLGDGFKMMRKQIKTSSGLSYGAWQILAPNGDIAGFAADKNRDGFVDYVALAGKYSNGANTTSSDRNVKGMDWSIKESNGGISKMIEIDLLKEPYASSFGGDAVDRCLDAPGNPATIVSLAAKEHNWKASDTVITNSTILAAAGLGGWEGLQKGARGATVGINAAADSTAHGLKTLFWDLPSGAVKMFSDPAKRDQLFAGINNAMAKLGAAPVEAWNQCLKETNNKFLESMNCFNNKVKSGAVKGLDATWNVGGKIASAIGSQIKKCWTEEGAEYQGGEYFAQCMGQISFYAATSAAGGGMVKAGTEIALKGGKLAQASGRALAITGEWAVDQTGLATLGPNKLQKLGDVVKSTRNEAGQLIDSGAKLDRVESQKINSYMNDYARHVSNPARHPAPVLDSSILKKVNAADPKAVERWQANVADAVGTVSPKYRSTADEILASAAYKDAKKSGQKVPSSEEITNLMKKIEKNSTIADKDVALDVVKKLKPEKIGDAVAQNSNLNFIKEMTDFHSKNGLGPVDADSVAKTINEWSPDAIDGLKQTLADANRIMRENPLESHARAVESVLKKKGATREQIMAVLPCTLGHGKAH